MITLDVVSAAQHSGELSGACRGSATRQPLPASPARWKVLNFHERAENANALDRVRHGNLGKGVAAAGMGDRC